MTHFPFLIENVSPSGLHISFSRVIIRGNSEKKKYFREYEEIS